jgi:hypothetical protein
MDALIETALLEQTLQLNEDEVILPLRVNRSDVTTIRALKLKDEEVSRVAEFQNYLFVRGYIPENTFASLVVYLFNLGYTYHKQVWDEEKAKEVAEA